MLLSMSKTIWLVKQSVKILFFTGAQLALGTGGFGNNTAERFITLATAALAIWNVGLAFLVGIIASFADRRGWLRI